jgi:hypothetical protein
MDSVPGLRPGGPDAVVLGGSAIPLDDLVNWDAVGTPEEARRRFTDAHPYPHLVVDDLFSPVLLEKTLDDFAAQKQWRELTSEREVTLRSRPGAQLGHASQVYFDLISSSRFVQFLTEITGIPGLLPDPLLRGGGLHESRPGGKFDMHLDFAKHPVTQLDNRLTLLTYLNKGWQAEWGGVLELWDTQKDVSGASVVPLFGRTLLFKQTPHSLHGHPHGVQTPDGRPRRSLAAYFYTNGREDGLVAERQTTFFAPPPPPTARQKLGKVVRAVLPPVVYDAVNALAKKPPSSRP